MFKIIIIFLLLNFYNAALSSIKDKIIFKLEKTENITFNFKQTINEKTEEGNCIIKYPKKIYCSYNNHNKKILVSDGKSLVIKNQNNNQYYFYSLKKTPLELILDKNYLIQSIKKLETRIINDKYYNYSLKQSNNKINIFFDKRTLNLVGWQTEDVYKNLVITFISEIKFNQDYNDNIFKLPSMN
jgi:outer membrane lipoprotein-sorting protein